MSSTNETDHGRDNYTIAWIAALSVERAAAEELLDTTHSRPFDFVQPDTDHNSYTWGCIGEHNIVVASLEAGFYGPTAAATTAMSMLSSFPHIRFGLLVGIGGGIPSASRDIRLGDIVVSQPSGSEGGVVQYDHVKAKPGRMLERKDFLNKPPNVLVAAMSNFQAKHKRKMYGIPKILKEMQQKNPAMFVSGLGDPGYEFQGVENDRLFDADLQEVTDRAPRLEPDVPKVHYGIITSGSVLVKDAKTRQDLLNHMPPNCECLCYEMEAAGIMNSFPCLVIRGVCDYADEFKNDQWQPYASATSAAFAKELLSHVPGAEVKQSRKAYDIVKRLNTIERNIETFGSQVKEVNSLLSNDQIWRENEAILTWLGSSKSVELYNKYKIADRFQSAIGMRYLQSPQFHGWLSTGVRTLFSPGMQAAGKTVVATMVISHLLEMAQKGTHRVAYHYFSSFAVTDQPVDGILCSIIKQLVLPQEYRQPIAAAVRDLYVACEQQAQKRSRYSELVACIVAISKSCRQILIVIDGLDQCSEQLIQQFMVLYKGLSQEASIKLFVTARPTQIIHKYFEHDSKLEISATDDEVELITQERLQDLPAFMRADEDLFCRIRKMSIAQVKANHNTFQFFDRLVMLGRANSKNDAEISLRALNNFNDSVQR